MNYGVGNEITYNAEVLKYNLCDYSDAYILLRGDITVTAAGATQAAFKNCASFTKRITKIDGTIIDDAEDFDLNMPMYNLIEYSSNYSETNNFDADIENTDDLKFFKYKAKLLDNTEADGANGIFKNATIAVSLKYLSNFWRSLKMPLINCKVKLKLK